MRISIPGKVFLLGEYAVLAGVPAWVVAVPPRFEWSHDGAVPTLVEGASSAALFHPESPAGRFLQSRADRSIASGRFADPWQGQGGFGGSTAEFAVLAYASGVRDAVEAWREYRKVTEVPGGVSPSGADLVGQWLGGAIEWNPAQESARDLSKLIFELPILFFSATHLPGRKTPTRGALADLKDATRFSALKSLVDRATAALEQGNLSELGRTFSAYADALAVLGVEAETVQSERAAIRAIPGVLGVKGCGAMQSDALAVLVESIEDERLLDRVVDDIEKSYGLRLLSCGVPRERGIHHA